ncbi:FAD-binding and (Fe-S)-binding domain-containing protein [Catenovulum maritimum]|uniref:D-2-hydroxyglutarate dehydrogenase n=1 Tax=Catenovulum maritimum TaxID=1513271 RepID=A0A0J8GU12_9ALTE|nr:FAD-binding and (Fe-S)-binding domain-containing protein [Catenovulum maritimum]KMT64804.1 membrane protein [Catenovulum maritimum]
MIPRLTQVDAIEKDYLSFLTALESSSFKGDIETTYASRFSVSTDNSVYQSLPQAVVLPKDMDDLVAITELASQAEFSTIKFSPRGGGTGTNGQSLTSGIVVDISRHMNKILDFNKEEAWVKVQAGVVKDQLNAFLKPHGFFFAPDLSTSNRATIGGMVSTDASGQGSLVYGKTSDHVLGLTSVLINGDVLETHKMPISTAETMAKQSGKIGEIYAQVLDTCRSKRQDILEKFPRLNRFLTGYDLEHTFNDDLTEFDLGRVITGSEGSLVFVAEAKLNLTPIAPFKTLVNVKYDSFESALRNAPFLVQADATSVETIDSKVLNLAREDIIWDSVSHLITDVPNKVMDGINIVEFNAVEQGDISSKLERLTAQLDELVNNEEAGVIGYQVTTDLASIGLIYEMRKKAVGLLGNTKGKQKPLAFAEDTAVPPENLADFIMEFRELLDGYKLDYGMFGHVDAGVLHVRPALDMADPDQEVILREISDKVVALTAKYGGLMWGEHGKGYRSEYGPEFFGQDLFNELRKIKAVFDPLNRVNPGKICTPIDSTEQLVSVDDTKRGYYDRQIPVAVKDSVETAMNCNGNGLCFNWDASSPMCPSYKATRDRRHSPKGRAGLMREWLRQLSNQGIDFNNEEKSILKSDDDSSWFARWRNTRAKKSGDYDYSHEVMEAMEECLACKACSSQCPIKVDVPGFRARFIQLYYSRYQRPLKDYMVATIERTAPLLAKAPRLSNFIVNNPVSKALIKSVVGYVDTPELSYPTLSQQVAELNVLDWDLSRLSKLSEAERLKVVAIVQDPFTSYYDATVVSDWVKLIAKLGYKPIILPFQPNGKPEHVKGFLKQFASTAKSGADFLNQIDALHISLVGTDPSLALCYRDEYNKALGDARGDFNVMLPHEWLKQVALPKADVANNEFALFAHCSEKTSIASTHKDWVSIFSQVGAKLTPVNVGCCGMAGTYGHEASHLENSKHIYQMSWADKIKQQSPENVLATGYSCRSQVNREEGFKPKHPVQALLKILS